MDLVRIADMWEANQEYLKQRLGRSDSSLFGAHWVLMPDVPLPRFNHVSRIRLHAHEVDGLLAEARSFFHRHGIPQCSLLVTPATRPADLAGRLDRMGFTTEWNPVMVWDGTPVGGLNPLVRVERAAPEQASLVFDILRRVFFAGASEQLLVNGRRGVAISYAIGAVNYLAYIGDVPVGGGMLFIRGGMGGIYNMGTLPAYRGRGVARAILAACLADAEAAGCAYVGLTPTAMGRPLYERLGFREVYRERYMAGPLN